MLTLPSEAITRCKGTKKMLENTIIGNEGENVATEYLKKRGYKIRHTRWHCGHLELDIVAEKDGMLVVVEVKTRSTSIYGNPESAVNNKKIRRIVNATDGYIKYFRLDLPVRFDIIAIIRDKTGLMTIEHIEDAFMSPMR